MATRIQWCVVLRGDITVVLYNSPSLTRRAEAGHSNNQGRNHTIQKLGDREAETSDPRASIG